MDPLDKILAVILGGGQGTRLYPLTKMRSKPAVPIAGKYRLIDVPISNCINSGIFRVAILTQFNSVSLHRHITQTYSFDVFHPGWVQIWAAEQTMESTAWYQGTADAIRKQLNQIRTTKAEYVLILAGDHLYRMDFAEMAQFHFDHEADITVAVQPVLAEEVGRFGILKRDASGLITDFAEKPKDPAVLAHMVSREDPARPYLGSMGIYLFRTQVLIDLLNISGFDDFGKHVIPSAIGKLNVVGYDFDGYWEDIGTIRSFYETNLALTMPNPPFDLFDPDAPIYTHPRFLPGSTLGNSQLENVLLAEGCCIRSASIKHSIIGVRSQINHGVTIIDSIIMGADTYDQPFAHHPCEDCDTIPIGIGSNCYIEGAIIDKNARVGHDVVIRPFPLDAKVEDRPNWVVRDGIVVVPKEAVIPPGTHIEPG
jgi:glucose-1-phosphate adenylyltransferase